VRFALLVLSALTVLATTALAEGTSRFPSVRLDVPVISRPLEKSATTSLAMVLAYYGADSLVWSRVERAFLGNKPVSAAALAQTVNSLGYDARVATPGMDSLATFLRAGIPPVLAIDSHFGSRPRTRYVVVTRFDSLGTRFFTQSGSRPLKIDWYLLNSQWSQGGGRALIVTRR